MTYFKPSRLARGLAFFTSLAAAANIEVTVGKDSKLEFNPPDIKAAIGDTITYKFFAKNHAVAQSTFADPCHLQENGIFSGFTPNTSPDVAAPTDFTITINDTKPLWFYCPQTNGDHCQKGMVHSINAPDTGNTFDAYKAKALQAATPSTPPAGTLPVGGLRKLHIDVGFNGELMFNPNNVTELIGTVVEFSYNPANHSIVQSSFDKPCQPIEREGGGFVAPFVPTQQTPSGVTFEVTLTNPDPIWFYCAQTKKSHCQSGMVGSINAAATGAKTFQAFRDLAAQAPPSTITPNTPLIGALKLNGTFIASANGAVLDTTTLDPSLGTDIPGPETAYPPYIDGMAGGSHPGSYNWNTNTTTTANISDEAAHVLRSLQYIDNFLVTLLLDGFTALANGVWTDTYPASITQTLGSATAQALVLRRTYTDALQHFERPVVPVCAAYDLASLTTTGTGTTDADAGAGDDQDAWLDALQTTLLVSLGATLDALSRLAGSGSGSADDSWLIPALATGLGTRARASALVNLMRNRVAAAAPREVLIPLDLAVSYIATHHVAASSLGDDGCAPPSSSSSTASGDDNEDEDKDAGATIPALVITEKRKTQQGTNRVTEIVVQIPEEAGKGSDELFVAWLGPWSGALEFTPVALTSGNTTDGNGNGDGEIGTVAVPGSLSGFVWAVLTDKQGVAASQLGGVAVAGPEVFWVSQQWGVDGL